MPLEDLLSGPHINVWDLHPIEDRVPTAAERAFRKLQTSDLFSIDDNMWKDLSTGQLSPYIYLCRDQLLGVLVESRFRRLAARDQYQQLKETTLYNTQANLWNQCLYEGKRPAVEPMFARDQLLGVLTDAQFKEAEALSRYTALKETIFYDQQTGFWGNCASRDQRLENRCAFSYDQLLDVLIQTTLRTGGQRKSYAVLKDSRFYDADADQWHYVTCSTGKAVSSTKRLADQLLGLLLDVALGGPTADELRRRKLSTLHSEYVSEQAWHTSEVNLLTLLIEALVERSVFLMEPKRPLPEVRRF